MAELTEQFMAEQTAETCDAKGIQGELGAAPGDSRRPGTPERPRKQRLEELGRSKGSPWRSQERPGEPM